MTWTCLYRSVRLFLDVTSWPLGRGGSDVDLHHSVLHYLLEDEAPILPYRSEAYMCLHCTLTHFCFVVVGLFCYFRLFLMCSVLYNKLPLGGLYSPQWVSVCCFSTQVLVWCLLPVNASQDFQAKAASIHRGVFVRVRSVESTQEKGCVGGCQMSSLWQEET